jgi:hypothetical protein
VNGATFYVIPQLDSVLLGDTLSVYSSFFAKLKYLNGGAGDSSVIDLSAGGNVVTELHINALKGQAEVIGGIDSFKIIEKVGSLQDHPTQPQLAKAVVFLQKTDSFVLSFDLIPLKKGIYSVQLLDLPNVQIKCASVSVGMSVENNDNHIHYLQYTYYAGGPVGQADMTHSYCFKVY